jgi:altronate dehydratase small subunit
LLLSDSDNVATAVEDLAQGTEVPVRLGKQVTWVRVLEGIPYGFKLAVTDISRGASVIKYGEPIGVASSDIAEGQLVHVHNLEGARGRGDLAEEGER